MKMRFVQIMLQDNDVEKRTPEEFVAAFVKHIESAGFTPSQITVRPIEDKASHEEALASMVDGLLPKTGSN